MPSTKPGKRVALEVKAQMVRQEVNQQQLAESLGLSQAAVSRRLTGEVPFDVNELVAVAAALGITVADLMVEVPA